MLRKLSLITALVAALAVPATDALAWGRGGGGRGFGGRGFGGHGFYGGRGYYAAMAATMAAMGGPITAMAAMAATMAVTGGPIRPDRPEAAILAKLTNVKRTGWVTKLVQRRRPPGYRFRPAGGVVAGAFSVTFGRTLA